MKNVDLSVNNRTGSGNKQSRKLRQEDSIPAILYERGSGGRLLKINEREINNIISKNGENLIVKLKVDGMEIPAVMKEVQRNHLNERIIHVDFQPATLHEIIHAEVPIIVVNGEQIEKNGWVINKQMTELEIEGEVEKIPPAISVNAARYKVGQVLRVADLEISKELSIVNEKNEVIFSILPTKDRPIDLVFDRVEPELVTTEKRNLDTRRETRDTRD
ncbi:MAG: 50S ribosomal protein L25 [Clostridiaceae bacterium]|nr:50S ribosomal protein L25 [Clostridiaceae bacterium]